MYKHRPGRLLGLADSSFSYAILMVSIDTSKGQILFLLIAYFLALKIPLSMWYAWTVTPQFIAYFSKALFASMVSSAEHVFWR